MEGKDSRLEMLELSFLCIYLSLEEEGVVQTNSSLATLFHHICDLDMIII